jgi:hypothetical protein
MAFEIEKPIDAGPSPVVEPTKPRLLRVLGPGLITGASDDDPSGIATYSQAGAQFGYALTWTMLFTYPLMTAVQIVGARMGRTTGRGIAGNLRQHCPPWLLTGIVLLLLIAKRHIGEQKKRQPLQHRDVARKVPWSEAAKSLVIPSMRWDTDYLMTVLPSLAPLSALTCSFGRPPRKPRTSAPSPPGRS